MRFTFHDAEQTISFRADCDLAPSIIAACATEPDTVDALIHAMEPYCGGIAAHLLDWLLAFDATQSISSTFEPGPPACALPPLPISQAVEVVDWATTQLAQLPDEQGILSIHLPHLRITGSVPASSSIRSSGVLTINTSPGVGRHVSYVLGDSWVLDLQSAAA